MRYKVKKHYKPYSRFNKYSGKWYYKHRGTTKKPKFKRS